jgi:glycosyltransferase involved in cell wall biosynthesis
MVNKKQFGVFIVPRGSKEWKGNEAGWITASGWASAGKELFGHSVVATSDGVYDPIESRLFPISDSKIENKSFLNKKFIRNIVPEFFITAIKDYKLKKSKPKIWPIENNSLSGNELKIIWERHDLFTGLGNKLARKYNVPLVTSVEALAVWEAEKWGVKRPFWGKWLENKVEAKALKNSDLICCVSQEVKEKVISMGINGNKVIVTPNRVDSTLFNPEIDGTEIFQKYNLKGKKVIGWTGSFRGFHAIDDIIFAFREVHEKFPETLLMLVGDGLEFEAINTLVNKLNLADSIIFTGKVPFVDIPKYVINFDISLVSAKSADGFHYSPLKLREYLAAGKAVIAPLAGDLPELFKDGSEIILYKAGNYKNLSEKIILLLSQPELKEKLEINANLWFESQGSWIHELKRVCDILKISY